MGSSNAHLKVPREIPLPLIVFRARPPSELNWIPSPTLRARRAWDRKEVGLGQESGVALLCPWLGPKGKQVYKDSSRR